MMSKIKVMVVRTWDDELNEQQWVKIPGLGHFEVPTDVTIEFGGAGPEVPVTAVLSTGARVWVLFDDAFEGVPGQRAFEVHLNPDEHGDGLPNGVQPCKQGVVGNREAFQVWAHCVRMLNESPPRKIPHRFKNGTRPPPFRVK